MQRGCECRLRILDLEWKVSKSKRSPTVECVAGVFCVTFESQSNSTNYRNMPLKYLVKQFGWYCSAQEGHLGCQHTPTLHKLIRAQPLGSGRIPYPLRRHPTDKISTWQQAGPLLYSSCDQSCSTISFLTNHSIRRLPATNHSRRRSKIRVTH